MTFVDNRSNYRKPLRIEVVIAGAPGRFKGFSRNISIGGMLVESPMPFDLEEEIQLQFFLPKPADILVCVGRVRWILKTLSNGYMMGISFTNLGSREMFALRDLRDE